MPVINLAAWAVRPRDMVRLAAGVRRICVGTRRCRSDRRHGSDRNPKHVHVVPHERPGGRFARLPPDHQVPTRHQVLVLCLCPHAACGCTCCHCSHRCEAEISNGKVRAHVSVRNYMRRVGPLPGVAPHAGSISRRGVNTDAVTVRKRK